MTSFFLHFRVLNLGKMMAVSGDSDPTGHTARNTPETEEPSAAAGSLVRKHHPNHRLVKSHRCYTVEEIARLFGVHKNTVREWIKDGLPTSDDKRPMLIFGPDLIAFLQARRSRNKHTCQPGEMYCVRCRTPKFPAGRMADYQAVTEKVGNLTAICPDCGSLIHRCVSMAKLGEVSRKIDIRFPQALRRLSESNQPAVNSDL